MKPTNEYTSNGTDEIITNDLKELKEVLQGGTETLSAIRQLEENLSSKIREVERLVTENEKLSSLLAKHNSDIILFKSQTEAKVSQLEAQIQEREESIRLKEHTINEQEENLPSKIQELELRLTEKENLLSLFKMRNAEITNLRSQIDGFQVFDLSTEASFQLAERGLCLTETLFPFLEMSHLNDMRSKLDALRNAFENIVNLRKDDTTL
jgi:chromosome segregation ATPase